MPNYSVTVVVEYNYDVEADSRADAETEAWNYENYPYAGSVYSIDVEELSEDEDESI